MDVYAVKPLEWKEQHLGGSLAWRADTLSGVIWITKVGNQFALDAYGDPISRHASLDDGKAKAEAFYREKLMQVLVPVKEEA